jgi:hypothetical protein
MAFLWVVKMSILESDEFIDRQVEILDAIEDILKKEGDEINEAWLCDEPAVVTAGTYKYVYYSIYVYSEKHRAFKIPILKQTYYNNELLHQKLYSAKEALEEMSMWTEEE